MAKPWMDTSLSADERAALLLEAMTLEEKIGQMVQLSYYRQPKEQAEEWARRGAGSFMFIRRKDADALQRVAVEESRLGIPLLLGLDAVHGHTLNPKGTIFPSQLGAACSWDREMIRQMGRVTAREVTADGMHWVFSPVLCLARDTRWGRVDETFGEDPCLAGELGAAIVKGYQGDSLAGPDSVLACAKHFIGYGEATGARDAYDTSVTYRKIKETFLSPFQKVFDAGCQTAMTAYGSIDGTPLTASPRALKGLLKGEAGFPGFVVTDYQNVQSLVDYQHVADNMVDASALAASAGNDMMMLTPRFYTAAQAAVRQGLLDEAVINEAARRILRVKFLYGLFDTPVRSVPPRVIGCDEHLALSQKLTFTTRPRTLNLPKPQQGTQPPP